MQWVIEKGAASDRSLVVQNVVGQVLALAQQKFASNVVEKCVLHGSDEERNQVIEEVLGVAPDGSSVIKAMLVHPYANYVMQSEDMPDPFVYVTALLTASILHSPFAQRFYISLGTPNVSACMQKQRYSLHTCGSIRPVTLSI